MKQHSQKLLSLLLCLAMVLSVFAGHGRPCSRSRRYCRRRFPGKGQQ